MIKQEAESTEPRNMAAKSPSIRLAKFALRMIDLLRDFLIRFRYNLSSHLTQQTLRAGSAATLSAWR